MLEICVHEVPKASPRSQEKLTKYEMSGGLSGEQLNTDLYGSPWVRVKPPSASLPQPSGSAVHKNGHLGGGMQGRNM